ncbi:MAG: hypothetical protein JXM73_05690 [Anaerolineae bacterium]|nr:hypothetical protein [Anaerolineae bacterium]
MIIRRIAQLSLLAVLLACCTTAVTPTSAPEPGPTDLTPPVRPTLAPTFTPVPPTAVPSPTPTPVPRTCTICVGEEPRTLFLYGEPGYARDLILEAIYDGPIDMVGYEYRPVILEKLPSLADGDAAIEAVRVQAGDRVVDNEGRVVELAGGVAVRPAGCRQASCAIGYDGGPLEMDQMSVTFRLLPGLAWSDGTPLTAEDSVFGFQLVQAVAAEMEESRYAGPAPDRSLDLVERTAFYTAPDERTVQWVGMPGFVDPDYQANLVTPQPCHLLADQLLEQLAEGRNDVQLPLGWGPYILKQWIPGDRILAERNPNYFRAGEGLPAFDRLVFRFVGQDAKRSLAELEAGRCDLLAVDTGAGGESERLAELEAAGALRLYAKVSRVWEHLDFGIDPAPDADRPDLFENARLRQAMAKCIDRRQVVERAYLGQAVVMHSYIPPDHPLYLGSGLSEYGFDPGAARSALERLGWRDADGDGVREAHGVNGIPDGTPLAFRYDVLGSESEARIEAAGLIAADLATCGISATITVRGSPEFFASGADGLLYGRRFDLAGFAWVATRIPSCDLYTSGEIPSAANDWRGDNVGGYSNPEYDLACQAALEALPGSNDYTGHHLRALRLFADDLPALPLAARTWLVVARPDLVGPAADPAGTVETWNVEEWRLEP